MKKYKSESIEAKYFHHLIDAKVSGLSGIYFNALPYSFDPEILLPAYHHYVTIYVH